MAEESAVKVCVRVRPFLEREKSDSSEKTKSVEVFWEANENSLRQLDDGTTTKSFAFDRVFTAEETTNQLYQDIAKPLVVSTVEGYNGTIFAYGQTASGKTFTMMGSDNNPGIIPLAVDDVFQTIKKCPKKEFLLRVSYMEIYNETVTDLLVDSYKRKPLEVREDVNKNISVADLTEELVTTPAQALKWIRLGEKNRHYGSTKMNHRSSRSHTIFRMILESRERSDLASGENADGGIIVSHLNLVDLAGSERASQTGAEGARFKEGCMINRSLFTLGQVIKKLSEESQRSFISYRDSKLTRILQNSLGGNAKTVIMCTITTASLDETLSTLQFASAAKKMKNDPHVTEVCDDGALLKRYRNEIVDLKKRLQEVSSVTATEKEVLVQVLQEKEQLQLEQEDRIKNLTKLLVTSNNITNVLPVPKRRVTWGGKMLRHSHSSTPDSDASNCSFSVSVCQKTKTLQSCVGKISEEGEEFYSDWTFPDEPFDDTNSCEDFVTLPSCGNRVTELELQLQTVDQQKQQAVDQILAMEQKAAEIDLKLKMETDEKELLASERDYLKQQLAIIKSHAMREKEEAAALSQKLKEKMEQDEFVSLEEKFAKEHEIELQNEISSLKNALESHELQLLELKKKLDMVSEELKEKTKIADDLQNMCGKDLAQEVANLRRSLDDAQALGRETKKEWALLRSENTALEELKMTLTVTNEKMEAEVTSLRSQLSSEKSNFKKMQMDLQKELNVVFNENTKLAALCDGKVPRNIMDSVELESAVTKLKKELEASQQAERLLRTQLEELELIQAHQNEGHNPEKQISAEDLEKLELAVRNVTAERDQFQMDLQENIDMMIENQEELRNSLGEIVALKQRIKELEDMTLGLEEIKTHAAENESLLQSLQSQLQQQVQRNKDIESTGQENQVQLQNQIKILAMELEIANAERDALCNKESEHQTSLEETQKLISRITSLSEEKDELLETLEGLNQEKSHLNAQLEDSIETTNTLAMELETVKAERDGLCNKEEPHQTSLEETQKLMSRIISLSKEKDGLLETLEGISQEKSQLNAQLEDKIETTKTLAMELETVKAERDGLCNKKAEHQTSLEETQKLMSKITSLSEEKDELLETVEGLNKEKSQLNAQLEDHIETITILSMELETLKAESLCNKEVEHQTSLEETQKLMSKITSLTEEKDELMERLEGLNQERSQLSAQLEDHIDTIMILRMELETLKAESDGLCHKEAEQQTSLEETQKLMSKITSLSEEKDEQLETVEGLNQEKSQLNAQLEDHIETITILSMELETLKAESDGLCHKEAEQQTSLEETQKLMSKITSLSEEKDELLETVESLNQEKTQLNAQLEDKIETITILSMELESLKAARDGLCNKVAEQQTSLEETQKLMSRIISLSEEKDGLLETLEGLNQEKSQLKAQLEDNIETRKTLAMELENVKAERDCLCDKEAEHQTSLEETQKLMSRIQSLSGEKDELLETVEGLSQEKSQLNVQLEDKIETISILIMELETLKAERDGLCNKEAEHQTSLEETQKLMSRIQSLSGEKDELLETVEGLSQEKSQLNVQLEDKIETIKILAMELETVKEERDDLCNKEAKHQTSLEEAQNLMSRITSLSQQKDELLEKVDGVSQEKSQLKAQLEDNIEKTKILTMELETVKAERDGLFNKAAEHQTFLEETQKLMSQITSLSEEKDGLLETAEGLSQEKFLLNAQLEETMEMVKTLTGKLEHVENEQNVQLSEKSSTLEKLTCKVSSLSEERIQLQNKMEELISEKEQLKSELQSMLLMEAKETISVIHEKHRNCDQKMPDSKVAASSRLQDSSLELEELFERFQQFIDACTTPDPIIRDKILTMECFLNESETFPHAILKAHSIVIGFGPKNLRPLSNIIDVLLASGKTCKRAFQQLVENDVTMFEEGRLQDIFRGRSPATSCSFQDRECCSGEGHRLSELVKKRQLYVQKMSNVLKNLWAGLDSYHNELSAEVRERARFSKLVQEELNRLPLVMSRLESLFWAESDCRSKVTQRRKDIFQGILDERIAQCQELQHLKAQAECRLQEEKSMHCTLQQTLEETPTRSPQALFGNQQLIRLRQSEEEVKVLCLKNKQLEEAHHKANSCVSEYKMATQQLQIELLASQAQVVELKNATKTLKSQLQDLEKPEAAELQKVQAQLFKMELELRAASDEHRQEMERKDMALHLKEESIRKLKETLRTLQQQGEESFLQGEELADRLLNPRSLGNKSSVVQNEYVKQLQVKIAHLENVISTQQADLNKWKNRAVKMKYKSKADVKPSPPSTPTKRGLPASISVLLQSPQKPQNILGSPKMRFNTPQVPLNSPKSKFFDDDGYGESLARTRPAHFFDNSTLGLTADAKSDENSQKPNDCITQ
ncbi:centromere-associated protein E isoform X2 [Corythoichthys intestinalis]|uniref:centromere-associated protein E isoform X2 n=1 Tax=Corythoichthys intestinalis TaxID=161448 RepID=UPI0025A61FA6|nr:centromere-associated protein E isoform X2 [Corythoichthys intestinalis]